MPISSLPYSEDIVPGIPFDPLDIVVPKGIECPIEFNNLTMNEWMPNDRINIISMDGLDDADVRVSSEPNPGADGEEIFGNSYYGGRTIVINGRVEAKTLNTMRGMKHAIRSAFNDLNEHPLIWRTGDLASDHQIFCRKVSIQGLETQINNRFERDFQITLRASNPRFMSFLEQVASINLATTTEISIKNIGNYSSNCIVVISGYAEDPSFTNLTTGQHVHTKPGYAIEDGRSWKFDMSRLGIKLTDNNDNKLYDLLDTDAERIFLVKSKDGPNVIKMDAPPSSFGSNARLSIYWRHSWI